MEEFAVDLLRQLPQVFIEAFSLANEFKGSLSEEALRLIFLPFHEFSIASCIIAVGWVVIFWKNKGLLISGLSHMFHIVEWFHKAKWHV